MGRPRRTAQEHMKAKETPTPEINRTAIQPTAVYLRADLPRLIYIGDNKIAEEIDAGRLRCKHDGRRQIFLGQWLLDWLQAQEAPQPASI
jgi:hypothetical protein